MTHLALGKDFFYFFQFMITLSVILLLVLVIGFIVKIQLHYHTQKKQHAITITRLKDKMAQSVEIQKTLLQQAEIIDHFTGFYKNSQQKIVNEIAALQFEFLKTISEK